MTTLAHLMSERGIQIPSLSNQSENTWIEISFSAPPTSKNFPATQPKNLRPHTHTPNQIHNFSFSFNGGGTTS